jgi:prevent-host-death family protein
MVPMRRMGTRLKRQSVSVHLEKLKNDHGNDYDQGNWFQLRGRASYASEFKAKCLHLMDEVNRTGEEIVITKNGKPVSILKPYRIAPTAIFGLHKGKIQSKDDLIAPLDIAWDAE